MSYKTTLGVTVDHEVKEWLVNWADQNKTNLSTATNYWLKKIIKIEEDKIDSIKIIKCSCGAEYSEKLDKCPSCSGVKSD